MENRTRNQLLDKKHLFFSILKLQKNCKARTRLERFLDRRCTPYESVSTRKDFSPISPHFPWVLRKLNYASVFYYLVNKLKSGTQFHHEPTIIPPTASKLWNSTTQRTIPAKNIGASFCIFILLWGLIILCVWYFAEWMSVHHACASDPLELEWWSWATIWMLEAKSRFSGRAAGTLNHLTSCSQPVGRDPFGGLNEPITGVT